MVHTGLVILEASYGPSERDEGIEGLDVDVTVPLQALVNSSQLYIPGKRSKVSHLSVYPLLCAVRRASSFPVPRYGFSSSWPISGLGGFNRIEDEMAVPSGLGGRNSPSWRKQSVCHTSMEER